MHTLRRGSGPALLLVHGLGSSSGNWAPILDRLAAQRSVVAIDLPGFGKSAPLSGPVTVATLTDAVETFISAEGLAGSTPPAVPWVHAWCSNLPAAE